jgi:uncharacterized protein (DUF1778 family)
LTDIKTEWLRVRVTPAEKEIFARVAEMEGVDISVLIRMAARKEAARILVEAGEENPFYIPSKKPRKAK